MKSPLKRVMSVCTESDHCMLKMGRAESRLDAMRNESTLMQLSATMSALTAGGSLLQTWNAARYAYT